MSMVDRLYYSDAYCREFDAITQRVDERDGRTLVQLDRTAFYPTSGGQPSDIGMLGECPVVDVVDEDDGTIAHVIKPGRAPRPAVGQPVHGSINWARRFDHMQQHTGQHLLSAAFDRLFDAPTIGFHLGVDASTIDIARELAPGEIAAAESEANRIVWGDRPVGVRFATAEEAARLPLRKEPTREGLLRLVEVEGFDLSACGGTHVARTGAVGVVVVPSWERVKGGQRIEFLCGERALGRFRSLRDTTAAALRLLSVGAAELPAAIERCQSEAKEHRRVVETLQGELARYRAGELAASAEVFPQGRLVLGAVDTDAAGLKALALAVAARPGHVVVLVSAQSPSLVVVARSADVGLKAGQVVSALTAMFGGRGGGRPELAQGGGLLAQPDQILSAARAAIVGERA